MTAKSDALLREIKAFGLTYPDANIRSPWPEHADLACATRPSPG